MSMNDPQLVPELAVTDLSTSLSFWVDLIGFSVMYSRLQEGFAYLALDRAQVMLDQSNLGRTWRTGDLSLPLGRGVNFQINVPAIEPILDRLRTADTPLFVPAEEKWYPVGDEEAGVRQFLVQDPDGYLLRLQASVGRRLSGTTQAN